MYANLDERDNENFSDETMKANAPPRPHRIALMREERGRVRRERVREREIEEERRERRERREGWRVTSLS